MKAKEIHQMSLQELRVEDDRLRRRLYELRCQAVTEKIENPRQMMHVRRDIARIQTELSMKRMRPQSRGDG